MFQYKKLNLNGKMINFNKKAYQNLYEESGPVDIFGEQKILIKEYLFFKEIKFIIFINNLLSICYLVTINDNISNLDIINIIKNIIKTERKREIIEDKVDRYSTAYCNNCNNNKIYFSKKIGNEYKCEICNKKNNDLIELACGHIIHKKCLKNHCNLCKKNPRSILTMCNNCNKMSFFTFKSKLSYFINYANNINLNNNFLLDKFNIVKRKGDYCFVYLKKKEKII